MKISQMTTDQAADVIIKITEPAASIMHDDAVVKKLGEMANGSDKPFEFIADNLLPVLSVLLENHRCEVYAVFAALTGKTAEEFAKQPITQTIRDFKESFDSELVDFFGSL